MCTKCKTNESQKLSAAAAPKFNEDWYRAKCHKKTVVTSCEAANGYRKPSTHKRMPMPSVPKRRLAKARVNQSIALNEEHKVQKTTRLSSGFYVGKPHFYQKGSPLVIWGTSHALPNVAGRDHSRASHTVGGNHPLRGQREGRQQADRLLMKSRQHRAQEKTRTSSRFCICYMCTQRVACVEKLHRASVG